MGRGTIRLAVAGGKIRIPFKMRSFGRFDTAAFYTEIARDMPLRVEGIFAGESSLILARVQNLAISCPSSPAGTGAVPDNGVFHSQIMAGQVTEVRSHTLLKATLSNCESSIQGQNWRRANNYTIGWLTRLLDSDLCHTTFTPCRRRCVTYQNPN